MIQINMSHIAKVIHFEILIFTGITKAMSKRGSSHYPLGFKVKLEPYVKSTMVWLALKYTFFYKIHVYKKHEAEIRQKLRNL